MFDSGFNRKQFRDGEVFLELGCSTPDPSTIHLESDQIRDTGEGSSLSPHHKTSSQIQACDCTAVMGDSYVTCLYCA